jgi:2-C-methyl-D-erythritol 4-phosphate cytidylyltransferase
MKSGTSITKQLMLLEGIPVIIRSAIAFEKSPYIDEIVLVTRKEELCAVKALVLEYKLKKVTRIVSGGESRQASARRGLEAISSSMRFIAIHDAARCLVTPDMIADVASAAYANRAASAGTACTDSVKSVTKDGYIAGTLDRDTVFRAQTPQIFDVSLYRAAAYLAKQREESVTDDNALVEKIGQAVKLVDCGDENIKITTKTDLYTAEAILRARREEGR